MNPIKDLLRKKYHHNHNGMYVASGILIGLALSTYIVMINDDKSMILSQMNIGLAVFILSFTYFIVMREKVFSLIIKNKPR